MLCPSCHTLNRDGARFCKSCGMSFPVEHKDATTPAAPVPTPSALSVVETPSTPASAVASVVSTTPTAEVETPPPPPDAPGEDITQAPTLLLSPQDMLAYHSKRWQQEIEREQSNGDQPEANAIHAIDIADEPTQLIQPAPIVETPEHASEPEPTAEPLTQDDAGAEPTMSEVAPEEPRPEPATILPLPEPAPTDIPIPTSAETFPVLAAETTLQGRYEVLQLLDQSEYEHTYQVVDHQGYRRCWNCASEQNAEGDEFCIDCGATLLNVVYSMHEYPAIGQNGEAQVLRGQIVNTFMENGHTYLIEQPQAEQPSFPNGVHLLVATDSDAGMVRRGEPNEDSTLVLQMLRIHESIAVPVGAFIVADGMGGHDNGQGASRMTINVIAEHITRGLLTPPLATEMAGEQSKPFSEDDCVALIKGAVEDANVALCKANQQNKSDMGSTITGFMIVGDHAYIINVGDSRTYMLREGKLYQLTNDHSLVGQLVAGGLIEPDDVYTHPQRSQIFRSLGDKINVQVDDFKQQLRPGDILLSCCDGLWEMIRNPQITEILTNAPDPQTACTQLIEAANTNGGEDNISAVVVFVRG